MPSPYGTRSWCRGEIVFGMRLMFRRSALMCGVMASALEGGLFDYGTDTDTSGNLQILRSITPAHATVAATKAPMNALGRAFNQTSDARTISHTREAFA